VRQPELYDIDRDAGAVPPSVLDEHSESFPYGLCYSKENIEVMTRDSVT